MQSLTLKISPLLQLNQNSDNRLSLLKKFSGLEVLPHELNSLFRSSSLIRFPEGRELDFARAVAVEGNFDLNSPLAAKCEGALIEMPTLDLLRKLAQIQSHNPHPTGWSLLLTLHGELVVSKECLKHFCAYLYTVLHQNFDICEEFRIRFGEITGQTTTDIDYLKSLCTLRGTDADPSTATDRQRFLMMLVPKLLVDTVVGLGWQVASTLSASARR